MASITHTVIYGDLGCPLDLRHIAVNSRDVVYKTKPFDVINWHHKKIRCSCMLYSTGKMICHGNKKQMRKYARILFKMGYPVSLNKVKIATHSAVYNLTNEVNYFKMMKLPGATYKPEIYHALNIKRKRVHFTVYRTGKVVITGITSERVIDDIVNPTLLELEIL